MVKKGPKVKIMGILIKNLVCGTFLTIFDQKNLNFQNRKKTFLTHVPKSSHTKKDVSKSKIVTCSLRTDKLLTQNLDIWVFFDHF